MTGRTPIRARWRTAVRVGLGVLCLATAGMAPAGPARAAEPPPNVLVPRVPVVPYDSRIVVPTDTVLVPPGPDVAPTDHPGRYLLITQMDGPNIAWGHVAYNHTATGPAAGVRILLTSRQTGWGYATVSDRFGRFRAAVPNGTYSILLSDPSHPAGLWLYPENPAPYFEAEYDLWGGGLGAGRGLPVIPRPRHSCSIRRSQPALVVEGTDGWAPGTDAASTPCPYSESPPPTVVDTGGRLRDDYLWALTGRDPEPDPATTQPPPATPPAAPVTGTSAVPAGPLLRSRTVRPKADGRLPLSVRCVGTRRCRVRLDVLARSRPVVTARRTLAAARTSRVVLRPSPAGRARLRRVHVVRVVLSTGDRTATTTVRVRR